MSSPRTDWTVLALTAVLALGFVGAAAGSIALRPRRPGTPPGGEGTLPELRVLAADGQASLLGAGGGVVLIASAGCPHCRRVVEKLAAAAHGRPPRFQVVVLEGHAAAGPLLSGAPFVPVAPVEAPQRFLKAVGSPAVPMLLWVGEHRQVLGRTLGEISTDEAHLWLARASAGGRHGS